MGVENYKLLGRGCASSTFILLAAPANTPNQDLIHWHNWKHLSNIGTDLSELHNVAFIEKEVMVVYK